MAWALELKQRSRLAGQALARRVANLAPPMRVFDFGFGDGELLQTLVSEYGECAVFGADIVPAFVSHLAVAKPSWQLSLRDGNEALARTESRFDLIVLSHVLYYFPRHEWGALLRLAARRLTPRGKIAIALVSQHSAGYQEPVNSIMAAAGSSISAQSADGGRYYAEDLATLLPAGVDSWDVPWNIALPPDDMASFLAFLYRFSGDLSPVRDAVEGHLSSLAMSDRWMLLTGREAHLIPG